MFGMFGPKTKEDVIKKILKYKSEPRMYSDVVPYEKEIRQLKDKFNIDDGEIEKTKKNNKRRRRTIQTKKKSKKREKLVLREKIYKI